MTTAPERNFPGKKKKKTYYVCIVYNTLTSYYSNRITRNETANFMTLLKCHKNES